MTLVTLFDDLKGQRVHVSSDLYIGSMERYGPDQLGIVGRIEWEGQEEKEGRGRMSKPKKRDWQFIVFVSCIIVLSSIILLSIFLQ